MTIDQALKEYFDFGEFRYPQREVIEKILEGRDVIVIMPTGGGKSLCYQLPALMSPGLTLIISPLIALIKDQVDSLRRRGLSAAGISSMQSASEQHAVMNQMERGELKLVYVAPERFRSQRFVEALNNCEISRIAVDEAHCLSQWGHDFRPDYLHIGKAIQKLSSPRPSIGAFTATATPEVCADIRKHLNIDGAENFIAGFGRPNLHFSLREVGGEGEKFARIEELIDTQKTGIIYCATRKSVTNVSEYLNEKGITAVSYHGGFNEEQREEAQNLFMDKKVDIAVATNAFGMGIDRSDIRFVVHFEMPGSIEALYQEGGRAGRDGRSAYCECLFNFADKRVQEFFIEGSNPGVPLIRDVYNILLSSANVENEIQMSIDDIKEALGRRVNPMAVSTSISVLNRRNYIERFNIPGVRKRGTRLLKPDTSAYQLDLDEAALQEKERRDKSKLKAVIQYAYAKACRQQWILRYFGEKTDEQCGKCDNCNYSQDEDALREPNEDEALILKKALSGVARMSRRSGDHYWIPRFGKQKVIQCLMGSEAKTITDAGLDQLTTHGLLKDVGKRYLQDLFQELDREGLVVTDDGEYPLLGLTDYGSKVMLGEDTCKLSWPEAEVEKKAKKKAERRSELANFEYDNEDFDDGLYQKMREKRAQLARARGGVPAYTIFSDKVLKQLATVKPMQTEDALDISGIGEVKARKVLPSFLRIIQAHVG